MTAIRAARDTVQQERATAADRLRAVVATASALWAIAALCDSLYVLRSRQLRLRDGVRAGSVALSGEYAAWRWCWALDRIGEQPTGTAASRSETSWATSVRSPCAAANDERHGMVIPVSCYVSDGYVVLSSSNTFTAGSLVSDLGTVSRPQVSILYQG